MDWEDAILQKQELRMNSWNTVTVNVTSVLMASGSPLTEDGLKRNSSRKIPGCAP